ncbi:MAG: transposase [FCB group bacterium]|nr:transposase [FCB group bacterium]
MLFEMARPAFRQQRTFERARRLALSLLLCLGRRTVTGMLCTSGQQFHDWSANYRLFEQERIDVGKLFSAVVQGTLETLPEGTPIIGAIDDTLIRKKGRRIAGTSWRRDPLGPTFTNNFIWASRFLQVSLAMPERGSGPSPARMIPVDLRHCPSPRKPGKRGTEEQWAEWEKASHEARISAEGARRLAALRDKLDKKGLRERPLIITADGTFTCREVFKNLPERTHLIGRIRKDARLYKLPTPEQENQGRGRRRAYGDRLPTPEEMRQDESIPWIPVRAHAAGKEHEFSVKEITPCRWKHAGGERTLRLIIVRPLGYRLRKRAPKNYRAPAYLITTDMDMTLEELLQAYIWRWEIEVNFRDEKTLLGLGEAQVRTRRSVETLTPFLAAVYAMLLLALEQVGGQTRTLPPPKWQRPHPEKHQRTSTGQALRELRAEIWGDGLRAANKTSFMNTQSPSKKLPKIEDCARLAVCYATG